MANTFTQIYIHVVFAVQGRQSLIQSHFKEEVYRYITGIVQHPNRRHKMIAINGMPDHLHILIGLQPTTAVSDIVREIKASSSGFINKRGWIQGHFAWQRGFGGFSVSRSGIRTVARYIEQQEEHHRVRTFREEYEALLREYEIAYDSKYLFEFGGTRGQ